MITMKKSYITPATVVVNIAPTTTLLNSSPFLRVDWEDEVEAGDVEVKGYSGRAGSVDWDDDWSE